MRCTHRVSWLSHEGVLYAFQCSKKEGVSELLSHRKNTGFGHFCGCSSIMVFHNFTFQNKCILLLWWFPEWNSTLAKCLGSGRVAVQHGAFVSACTAVLFSESIHNKCDNKPTVTSQVSQWWRHSLTAKHWTDCPGALGFLLTLMSVFGSTFNNKTWAFVQLWMANLGRHRGA